MVTRLASRCLTLCLVTLGLVTLGLLAGRSQVAAAAPATPFQLPLQRTKLAGGLRIVMNVDRSAPLVVVAMSYLAGTADEPSRRSGAAQLVERMMFAGSAQVGDGQHRKSIAAIGGWTAVERTTEVTSYLNVVPPEGVPLALWLEGQRMASLTVPAVALERERRALRVERDEVTWRQVTELGRARLIALALQGPIRHGHTLLNEVGTITASEVRAFHQSFYGPARAVLTVVGDFEPNAVVAAAKRYLDPIARPTAARGTSRQPPPQTTRRSSSLVHRGAHRGGLAYGWAIPGREAPDHAALEIAGALLAGGRASAVHRQLVVTKGKALQVTARSEQLSGIDVLGVSVELPRGIAPHDVAAAIEHHARRLGQRGPEPAALRSAQRQLLTRRLAELSDMPTRTHRLAECELVDGSAEQLVPRLARYDQATAEDVRRAAARYLVPQRSTVVESFAVSIPATPGAKAKKSKAKKSTKPKGKRPARRPTKTGGSSKR